MQLRSFLILIVLFSMACKSSRQTDAREYPIVMMERTICFGGCPAYLVNIYPDGYATYEGKSNAPRQGLYEANLTLDQLAEIRMAFEEANFFEFANVYSALVSDLPTTYIYYHDGVNGHKITDYYGAPRELKELEQEVDMLIDSLEWVEK